MSWEAQEAPVIFSIETGPHARVSRKLPLGSVSIGRSLDSDIVLDDATMSDLHVKLGLSDKGVKVSPLGGEVRLADQQGAIGSGQESFLRWPAHITVGKSRLRLSLGDEPRLIVKQQRSKAWFAVGGAAVLVAGALLVNQHLPSGDSSGLDAMATPAEIDGRGLLASVAQDSGRIVASPKDHVDVDGSAESKIEQAVAGLRQQLKAVALDQITVDASNGIVVIDGKLDSDDAPRWHDVEMWFDRRFGQAVPLDSRLVLATGGAAPDLMIRAVWAGNDPYLVAGDGQRYVEGAMVPGGWKIDVIEPDEIIFRREDHTFRFELNS